MSAASPLPPRESMGKVYQIQPVFQALPEGIPWARAVTPARSRAGEKCVRARQSRAGGLWGQRGKERDGALSRENTVVFCPFACYNGVVRQNTPREGLYGIHQREII